MNGSLESKWIRAGIILAFLLMGAVSFVSYQNATQLMESSQQVRQTNTVLQSLTDISATLTEAESGRWRYVLFQASEDLTRYQTTISSLNAQAAKLQSTLNNTPKHQQDAHRLQALITARIELLQQSLRSDQSTIATLSPISQQLRGNQDAIRQVIHELRGTEEELL